jgi:hypothetical protein
MEQLRHAVAKSDFLTLSVDCCNCRNVTDLPTTVLEIVVGGSSKQISHYHGCFSAPAWLVALENKIDEASGASRWIGTPAERRDMHVLDDYIGLHKDAKDSPIGYQR